jgi:hypothetical protein
LERPAKGADGEDGSQVPTLCRRSSHVGDGMGGSSRSLAGALEHLVGRRLGSERLGGSRDQ